MGIKFRCPNGHKLNVKSFLAGKKGICPHCGVSVRIPEGAENVSDDREGETEIQTGGTATLTKAMADTVTISSTYTVPATAAAATPVVVDTPAIKPVTAVTPVASQPVTPVMGTAVSVTPVTPVAVATPATVMPVGASPMAVVSPAIPVVPVGNAAPMGAPVGAPAIGVALSPSPYAMMPAAAVDPIAEAPNAVWYVRPPSGGQFGPARGDIMRKWLGEGRVSADSLVWRDGWQDWKSAVIAFPSLAPVTTPGSAAVGDAPIVGAPAKPSASRTLRAKKRSNTMAITMVMSLGLIAVVLLVVFIYVLSTMNQ